MSWIEVKASFERVPEDWSPLIDLFLQHGFENTLQSENPPMLTACVVEVPGAHEEVEMLCTELMAAGAKDVQTGPYEEQDWEQIWRQFFRPRRVGKRFVIRPTWEEFSSGTDDIEIVLDPGQAFGTGDHATTRMCLQLLEEAAVAGKGVLDVGCGSGILSIGARKLGAAEVLAVDIDPVAVEVTKENAELNGVDVQASASDGFPAANGQPVTADIVLSNIISAALIRFASDAAAAVKPGGSWIVSGILRGNWPDVEKAATQTGFQLEKKLEEDDWVAATFLR